MKAAPGHEFVVDGSLDQFLDLAETLRSRDFYVSEAAIREAVEGAPGGRLLRRAGL